MATNENQSIQKNFPVLQMTCAGCAAGVENKLKSLKGVKNAAVNFATATALVDFQPGEIDAEGIQKAVQSIGYDLVLEEENQPAGGCNRTECRAHGVAGSQRDGIEVRQIESHPAVLHVE